MNPSKMGIKSFPQFKKKLFNPIHYIIIVLLVSFTFTGYSQKNKNGGYGKRNKDIIPVIECVKDLRNGLYQATFGYKNPRNKEVVIDENGSIIKSNNGKKITKGLHRFKRGTNNKTFTKEFGSKDYVKWTIISNGRTHTVIANANSAKKCAPDDGFIEPVIGNGKSLDIIGQELTTLCENPIELIPSPLIFQIKEDKVLIEIVPIIGEMANLITLLQGQPFSIPDTDFLLYDATNSADLKTQLSLFAVIDVYFTNQDLCLLREYPLLVNFARPVYPATINSGGVISQGDGAQTSNIVRESFRTVNSDGAVVPVDGTGISIAVLSDSYDMALPGESLAAIDVANFELPNDVVVLKDNASKSTDEGRAMMQIIHDVAPGAKLQFHTATASPRQFEEGVKASDHNDIIVDDITFITEPFFIGTNRIATAIQSFLSQPGKFHFTSAGNLANKGYQSTFTASTSIPVTNFIPSGSPTRAHLFDGNGGTDYWQEISVVPGTYLIALQWKELLASQGDSGALDDLDIYIVDDLGRLLVGSNRINIKGDPTEIIVFRATGTGTANILITSANGDTTVPFRYIAFHTTAADGSPDGLKFTEYFNTGAPTVSGHAMIPESFTTGAVDYRFGDNPVAETFSSYGGLLSDNTSLEIDIYAPDGGNTSSTTIGQDAQCDTCDKDGVLNFYGTSAAAPHMAGAAALIMSAAPSWFPDGAESTTFTADQALQLFKTTATGFTAADGSSAGFLNTLAAFNNIAAQTAKITELVVEDGKTPSAEPFTVTIIGEFFPENIEDITVLFDGQPLENVAFETGENGARVITATVPVFTRNPGVVLEVKSKTVGDDGKGGLPAYFFEEGKIALNIIANSKEFEYGQDIGPTYYQQDPSALDYLPAFMVEGLPEGITFEMLSSEDNLPPIVLRNSALDQKLAEGDYPIVSDYVITPSFGDEVLAAEQLDKYQINFISGYVDADEGKIGYLAVTKKDLTITPAPISYTYGDAINLTLNYSYDITGISDNSTETGFYSFIEASHQSDFKDGLPNKFRAVVSKFRAVVSTETIEYDLLELLNGGSWSASDRTIENKFRAVVSGMNIIDLDNDDFTNYIGSRSDFDDGETNKFRAVVSKFRAVVSSEDLFSGAVDIGIENKFRAVVSKFRAVVSTEDPARPYSTYESVFSIIDAEDAPPEDGSDDERAISNMYALNMITGLEVTLEGTSHYVYPGAFLNARSANFNITYVPGSLIILPKVLTVSTSNLVIPYGTELTKDDLITSFDGWAFEGEFQESVATVFPEGDGGIPYYFIKEGGDGTELEIGNLKERGNYTMKVRDPQNYTMINTLDDTFGTLTIETAPLTFTPIAETIVYGESFVITPDFNGFADGEDATVLLVGDEMPYYFMKGDIKYEIGDKKNTGVYEIFLTDDLEDNYIFDPDTYLGNVTITEASLTFTPIAETIMYGESFDITPNFIGFADGEDATVLLVGDEMPYYYMKGDIKYEIGDKKNTGVYEIFLTDDLDDNYIFDPDAYLGNVTITEASLNFIPIAETIMYGKSFDITPDFIGFADGEDATVLEVDGMIPYYFTKDGVTYTLAELSNINVGVYEIFIIDDIDDNYIFSSDANLGNVSIEKANLDVVIDDLIINQGDTPVFTSSITGFAFGESIASVFDNGIVPYYVVDQHDSEVDYMNAGTYSVKIRDPKNYYIDYLVPGKLTVKARWEKIKIYLDCVKYDHSHDNHHNCNYHELKYTAKFRYVNPNNEAIVINHGSDNRIFGYGRFEDNTPTVFLPGESTFEIRFDGRKIIWKLKSLDGDYKRTAYAIARRYSHRCDDESTYNNDGHYDIDKSFVLYPNPVKDELSIEQKIEEPSKIEIYNIYGVLLEVIQTEPVRDQVNMINMSAYRNGQYFVRISVNGASKVYTIIKE